MPSGIIKIILQTIGKQGIVKRGIDEKTGEAYYLALILDGHISCMGLPFLKYVNNKDSKWGAFLVCPYDASKTQCHDHEIQKGNSSANCTEQNAFVF